MTTKELAELVSRTVSSSLSKENTLKSIYAALLEGVPEGRSEEFRREKMLFNAIEISVSLSTQMVIQMVIQALSDWHLLDLDSIEYRPESGEKSPHIVILDSHRQDE